MRPLLNVSLDVYGYKTEDITIMLDDEKPENLSRWPTHQNIVRLDVFFVGTITHGCIGIA